MILCMVLQRMDHRHVTCQVHHRLFWVAIRLLVFPLKVLFQDIGRFAQQGPGQGTLERRVAGFDSGEEWSSHNDNWRYCFLVPCNHWERFNVYIKSCLGWSFVSRFRGGGIHCWLL